MTDADRPAIVKAVQEGGVHEDAQSTVDLWARAEAFWPLVLEWRGQLLQVQVYEFPAIGGAMHVRAGFTRHIGSDRSHWFWRECEAPVWQRLVALETKRVFSYTRSDRPDWIDRLQTLYGAEEVGPTRDGLWTRLHFNPRMALAGCTGWPPRRSAAVKGVREITFDEAAPLITTAWGARARKALTLRIADEWFHLDNATLLEIGGHVRALRERTRDEARFATLTPVDHEHPEVVDGLRAWCKAAGYASVVVFSPRAYLRSSAGMKAHLERGGFKTVREIARPDGRYLEIRADV